MQSFLEGCTYPDSTEFRQHICYKDYCPNEARAAYALHAARNNMINGNAANASFWFGVACHYISDSVQPYHTGDSDFDEHGWVEDNDRADIILIPNNLSVHNLSMLGNAYLKNYTKYYKNKDSENASLAMAYLEGFAAGACEAAIKNEIAMRDKYVFADCSSIRGVISNKEACNFLDVEISGKITDHIHKTSKAGNDYTIFYLEEAGQRMRVFIYGNIEGKDGDYVGVKGTYFREKLSGSYTFYDEIDAYSIEQKNNYLMIVLFAAIIIVFLIFVLAARKLK
jgi:hypothetical protein